MFGMLRTEAPSIIIFYIFPLLIVAINNSKVRSVSPASKVHAYRQALL